MVLSILCLQITIEFRKSDSAEDRHVSVVFPRYSVAIMSGEARYNWTHGITPRTMDVVPVDVDSCDSVCHKRLTLVKREIRTSLTFRTVRQSAVCQCGMLEFDMI